MGPSEIFKVKKVLDVIETTLLPDDDLSTKRAKYITGLNQWSAALPGIDVNSKEVIDLIDDQYLAVDAKIIVYEDEFQPWLNEVRSSINFDFYDRYEGYLNRVKKWDKPALGSINSSTDTILDHMKNPKGGYFSCKGLVIGDIQSGKTANYAALINKSLDVGYKLVIVLAGTTNDLRKQTQLRLDSEVLGYETREDATHGAAKGVATVPGNKSLLVDCLTYNDSKGDFKGTKATIALSSNMNPMLAIVKKNTSVLKHLLKFISSSPDACYTNGKLDIPVLIIDDEVDQASVNTRDSEDVEEASKINGGIRKIIDKCNRCSYVGYTATPFANVFINPYTDPNQVDDLFPKNFIVCLPSSKGYSGIDDFFSISDEEGTEVSYDLCTFVSDFDDFFKEKPKKLTASTQVDQLANSLIDAILNFVIAASVKKSRGIVSHNSMLINIASVKCPATTLVDLVKKEVQDLYYEYKYEDVESKYRKFWEERIKPISKKRLGDSFKDEWSNIEPFILKTYSNIMNDSIKLLNGDSKDVIDYEATASGDWIIVGGNRLSRGLTLEGLIISYFYRQSKQYDTLLQMGRWFGYRKGWLDLCRVYADERVVKDFTNIGLALHELRGDITIMNEDGNSKTPLKFGLKIRTSPKLVPTAKNKMKSTDKVFISYSGHPSQTLTFDPKDTEFNFNLADQFVRSLGKGIELDNGKIIFDDIPTDKVVQFLRTYHEAKTGTGTVDVTNWANFVVKSNDAGMLKKWKVVLSSLREGDNKSTNLGGYTIVKASRRDREALMGQRPEIFKLKVNMNPYDFRDAFYNVPEMKDVETYSNSNPIIDKYFTDDMGVLSIQVTDIHYKVPGEFKNNKQYYASGEIIEDGSDVVGLSIWFPKSNDKSVAVEYYVNPVWIKEENKNNYSLED